jgi:SRSO17 transposase
MDARYAFRKSQLLDECQVAPEIFEQVIPRLYTFMEPFVQTFHGHVAEQHAKTYICGLLSEVQRKNVESIAYRFGQSRLPLQAFIGWDAWDDTPLRQELREQVKAHLGQDDGVLVFDPSGFAKSGRESVGVARQWCGRLGKVDNCQVALYVGYVSRKGHTLVDTRLFLPKEWTKDTARLDKAGVPKASRGYRTRHQLALEMLATNGAGLPHGWIAGDDEMGRPYWFRRRLAALGERYLLAVPSNTAMRDLEVEPPAYSGRGRRPTRPWHTVAAWGQSLADEAWQRIDVRDGSKGPLVVEAVKRRVVSRTHRRQQGDEETLVVIRSRDRDQQQVVQVDYYLSNALPKTPLWEFARVAKAEHRIEACLQRSKSEAGLADYEVRNWTGWQHHQTLSLLATWFLERETHRGKQMDPCDDLAPDSPGHRHDLARGVSVRHDAAYAQGASEALATQRACALLSLETAEPIGPIELR